eukprot:Polyplicarium_translucidae@DN3184_c0_g1_i1.p1
MTLKATSGFSSAANLKTASVDFFPHAEVFDKDNTLHVAVGLPTLESGVECYLIAYARSTDGGRTFTRSDGSPVELPMKLGSGGNTEPEIAYESATPLSRTRMFIVAMADGRPVIVASPTEYEGNLFALIVSDGAGGWTETSNPLLGEQNARYFGMDKLGVISMMWSNNRISHMMDPTSTEVQRLELWRTGNYAGVTEWWDEPFSLSVVKADIERSVPYP